MDNSAPLLSLGDPFERPIRSEGPPTTVREFLRWAKERDPEGYRRALRHHPVNQNISRDEKPHEVELEADPRSVERLAYERWSETAWS